MTDPMVENPPSAIADRAVAERRELIRRCAASVMREVEVGRVVDPHRVQWARVVLAGIKPLAGKISQGRCPMQMRGEA